ncbi:MAG: aromatic ring-hydroxylating dioxygenase subunit alpha [Robiginitomaculum sp.]|nr:aromatic ring-hydroxylating dioxygenase subunit alpha [Robiginitomaculum sp.]
MATALTFVEDIWYFAGLKSEFKNGDMTHRTIAGHPIVIGRGHDGKIFALRDICPHRAAPLSAGKILDDGTVECPYHGWRFGLDDGQCSHIPAICSGQKDPAGGIKVRNYPVRENGQLIWVWIAGDAKPKAEPDIDPPHWDMTDKKPLFIERLTLNCHVDHAVIGLMDPAHVSFLHRQWWWRTGGSMHEKEKKFAPRERGWAMAAHAPSSNSLGYKLLGGKPVTEIAFRLPGVRTEEIQVGNKRLLSFTAVVPIDDNNTEITQVFFNDFAVVKLLKPIIKKGASVFLNQDGDIIKLQAECLKHDPRLMLIDDADRQAKWYYMLKKEWAKSRAEGRDFVNPVKATTLRWRS